MTMELADQVPILSFGKYDIWLPRAPAAVIGGSSIGKSRWGFSLAIADILQRPFCGFQTSGPHKWLFISPENSVRRVREDLFRMLAGASPEQIKAVNDNFKIVANVPGTLVQTDLGEAAVCAGFRALASAYSPDIVVVDPWEAFIAGGDVIDAPATRRSLNDLMGIFPNATPLIVHHSREGTEAVKSASGFGATGFTKGSKTLTTMCRLIFNLTSLFPPDEAAIKGQGLVIHCGKSNDAPAFATRAVLFNERDGSYVEDETFNSQAYKDDVEGRRGKQMISIRQIVDAVGAGTKQTSDLVDDLRNASGAAEATVNRAIKRALDKGYLVQPAHGKYAAGPKAKTLPPPPEQPKDHK